MEHIRSWLFTPYPPQEPFLDMSCFAAQAVPMNYEALPVRCPAFLDSVQDMFIEAGQQLRVLDALQLPGGVTRSLVDRVGWMAQQEGLEGLAVAEASGDEWAACEVGFADVGVRRWCRGLQDRHSFSLPFRAEALQQVGATRLTEMM